MIRGSGRRASLIRCEWLIQPKVGPAARRVQLWGGRVRCFCDSCSGFGFLVFFAQAGQVRQAGGVGTV